MEVSRQEDDNFYKRVLNKSHKFLIDYLDPQPVLDVFISEEYLDRTQVRDIKDLQITSEKTRAIVGKVISKGVKGYKDFKRILRLAGQKRIVDHLQEQERQLIKTKSAAAPQSQQQTAQEEVIYKRNGQSADKTNGQSDLPREDSMADGHSLEAKQKEKSYRQPRKCCIYDGRLLKLDKKDIDNLKKNCTILTGEGGFGKVYKSEADVEGFGMSIAVKKVQVTSDSSLARREKNASRIMHPFILPLLAVVDIRNVEVWFVSPFMAKGDLCKVIKEDQKASELSKIQMNCIIRIRILLQIALAIEYIHTEVPNVRGVILHKDISSRNVVLDSFHNARLIDFGLAREKNDKTSKIAGTLCYLPPDIGTGVKVDESWDYYAFGIVIREMLTGLEPEGDGTKFLRAWTEENVREALQENVWPSDETEIFEKAAALNRIADTCLQRANTKGWTATNFKRNVVDKLYNVWGSCSNAELHALPKDHSRCHMCFINPQASKSSLKQQHADNCTQEIKACISCEKNSFLNPIRCYCRNDLKPSIGYKWGALLVAGNDKDSSLAEALKKDLNEFKDLITSKAPLIMGIREENVRIIVPNEPGKPCERDELSSRVKTEIQYFRNRSDIDTLLIYFSCHGKEGTDSEGEDCKNSFNLGSKSDTIKQNELEELLESLKNTTKLVVILDRCFPPILNIKGRDQIVQVNACKDDQEADFNNDGSTFTKYVIQGLKARSGEKCSDDCKSCDKYWGKHGNFITVHSLYKYVRSHMEEKNKEAIPDMQQKTDWNCIAYYTDEVVEIDFTSEDDKKHIRVPLKYLQNMRQLQEKIFDEFGKDDKTMTVKIKKDTFRKEDQFEVCDTMEKVTSAWIQRWPLTVVFEEKTTENSHQETSKPPSNLVIYSHDSSS